MKLLTGSNKTISICLKNKIPNRPIDVKHFCFDTVTAGYSIAKKIGLIGILQKNAIGSRYEMLRWLFFFTAIINRIDHSTSNKKMRTWAVTIILLSSKNSGKYLTFKKLKTS